MIILPDPSQHVPQAGFVKSWSIYATIVSVQHFVYLQVWRPSRSTWKVYEKWKENKHNDSLSLLSYRLINQVLVHPRKLRMHEIVLEQEFAVEVGDVIGLYFPKSNPVGWSTVPCSLHPFQQHRFKQPYIPPSLGDEVQFEAPRSPALRDACRTYSVKVHFGWWLCVRKIF